MKKFSPIIGMAAICFSLHGAALPAAYGTLIYDEVSGDLSGDPAFPTLLNGGSFLGNGSYEITGTMGGADVRDYFNFWFPIESTLAGIRLLEYTDVSSGGTGNRGYIHIDEGASSVIPGAGTTTEFLGGSHLDRTIAPDASFNLLNHLAAAPQGGTGFAAPLLSTPSGYTINVQQTGPQVTRYTLQINIIPEPSSRSLVLLGIALVLRLRSPLKWQED